MGMGALWWVHLERNQTYLSLSLAAISLFKCSILNTAFRFFVILSLIL